MSDNRRDQLIEFVEREFIVQIPLTAWYDAKQWPGNTGF